MSRPTPDHDGRPPVVRWRRRIGLIALLPLAIGLQALAGLLPTWIEANYSRGIFPYLAGLLHALFGWWPFSVAEIALVAIALYAFVRTFLALGKVIRGGRKPLDTLLSGLTWLLALAGAAAGLFLLLWGFNYRRVPLAEQVGWDSSEIEADELQALCEELVALVNELRPTLAEDADGVFRLREGRAACFARASLGYERARESEPWLEGPLARPKGAFLSPLMSRLGITGIYFPLTAEPHVNLQATDSEIPFAALHEVAHGLGFAREDEANFASFVACMAHPDADYRYSGALEGLIYSLNGLVRAGRMDVERALRDQLDPGIHRDLVASAERWRRYRSKVTVISSKVNDVYLKAQGESEGVESYGLVVELLVAQRRARRAATEELDTTDG